MSELAKRERDYGIDLIKVFAIIGVVMIHTCTTGYSGNSILSFDWISSIFWGSVSRASVPLFFMCSGALLLDPSRELTLRKLYTKNVLRIVVSMLVWASFYKVFHLVVGKALTVANLILALKEVVLFRHEYHFYFLHISLIVYAFLPITRAFVKSASRKELRYALIVWFLLGIAYPTLKPFWPLTLISGIPSQWMINMTYASIGYGLAGYYFKTYRPSVRLSAVLTALGFSAVFGFTVYFSAKNGKLCTNYFEGMSIGVAVLAMGVFGLLYNLKDRLTAKPVQTFLRHGSNASFCIYLVHVFWLYIFRSLKIDVNLLPCIVSVPLMVCVIAAISYLCYAVISRIPFVKKWII